MKRFPGKAPGAVVSCGARAPGSGGEGMGRTVGGDSGCASDAAPDAASGSGARATLR